MLIWLTVIVAAAIVLALAGYLVLIAVALTRAWRDVAGIAAALERTAEAASPLGEKVNRVNDAMRRLAERTDGMDARIAAMLGARR